MEAILVSACLLGVNCKYSGRNNLCPRIAALADRYQLIPVCPEQLGGLPTPRPPAEILGNQVISNCGVDVTEQYCRGAEEALRVAELFHCKTAILKSRSPSCGTDQIYDGSFSGKLIHGAGIAAQLLQAHGVTLYSEENFPEE